MRWAARETLGSLPPPQPMPPRVERPEVVPDADETSTLLVSGDGVKISFFGEEILVGLPDDTVQLLTTTATHCKCRRCVLSDSEGMPRAR